MRVHPLTRFTLPRGGTAANATPTLDLHILLLDGDGFDARGGGMLRITLAENRSGAAEPLRWEIDLEDLAVNRRHFDGVTRTYRMLLGLEARPFAANTTFTLTAELRTDGERTLVDRFALPALSTSAGTLPAADVAGPPAPTPAPAPVSAPVPAPAPSSASSSTPGQP